MDGGRGRQSGEFVDPHSMPHPSPAQRSPSHEHTSAHDHTPHSISQVASARVLVSVCSLACLSDDAFETVFKRLHAVAVAIYDEGGDKKHQDGSERLVRHCLSLIKREPISFGQDTKIAPKKLFLAEAEAFRDKHRYGTIGFLLGLFDVNQSDVFRILEVGVKVAWTRKECQGQVDVVHDLFFSLLAHLVANMKTQKLTIELSDVSCFNALGRRWTQIFQGVAESGAFQHLLTMSLGKSQAENMVGWPLLHLECHGQSDTKGGGGSGGGGGKGGSDGGNGGKGHWSGGGGGDSGAGNGGKGNGSNNLPGSDAAEGVRTLSALLEGTPRALHARCGNMWRMQVNALHVQGNALVVQGKKLAYAMMDPNSQLSRLENKGLPAVRKTAEFRGKCFTQDCYIPLAVGVKAEGKGPQWGVITEVWRLAATYGTILPTVEELDKQNWNGSIVGVLRFSSSSKRGTPEWVANGRWCEETEGWDVANHIDPERSQCLENFKQSVWADSKKDRPAGPEAKILPDVLADIQRQVLRLTALRTLKSPLFLYLPTSPPTPTSGQNHPTETETSKREKLKTSVERHLLVYMLAHDGVHEVIGLDSHLLLVPVDVAEMILCRSLVYGQTALPLDSLADWVSGFEGAATRRWLICAKDFPRSGNICAVGSVILQSVPGVAGVLTGTLGGGFLIAYHPSLFIWPICITTESVNPSWAKGVSVLGISSDLFTAKQVWNIQRAAFGEGPETVTEQFLNIRQFQNGLPSPLPLEDGSDNSDEDSSSEDGRDSFNSPEKTVGPAEPDASNAFPTTTQTTLAELGTLPLGERFTGATTMERFTRKGVLPQVLGGIPRGMLKRPRVGYSR